MFLSNKIAYRAKPGELSYLSKLPSCVIEMDKKLKNLPLALLFVGLTQLSSIIPANANSEAVANVYPVSDVAIFSSNQPGSKSVGLLTAGTDLILLQKKGPKTQVRIEGWYQKGAKRVLYAVPGKRILDLALKKKAVDGLADLEELTDPETGLVWYKASFDGWVSSNKLSSDADAIWEKADELFSTKCTACHERRIPHHYTANQWTGNIKAMAQRAGLSKKERTLILKFLQYRAKDMVEAKAN